MPPDAPQALLEKKNSLTWSKRFGAPRSICSQSEAFGEPLSPQIGFVPT